MLRIGKNLRNNSGNNTWRVCCSQWQHEGNTTYKGLLVSGCLLLLLFPVYSFAITESQFIDKVIAHGRLLEEAQIGLDIKQIEMDTSRDNYQNWQTTLSFELDYRYRGLDRDTSSKSPYTKATRQYPQKIALDFEKRFLSNPSSVAIGMHWGNDKTSEVRHEKRKNKDYEFKEHASTQYIRFKYPLLKHDSHAASLKTYHRDVLDLKRQKLLFYETKENFLHDRLNDYLSWVLYQQQMSINQESLNKLGHLQPKDTQETALLNSIVAQIENQQQDTQAKLHAIKQKLSALLNDREILTEIPEFDLHKRIVLIKENVPNYLKTHNRTLQRIALSTKLKQIDVAYYENQNLATLNFTAEAERNRSDRNSRTATYDDDKMNYAVGLEFVYPLGGNVTSQASLQKSLLGVRKLEISYKDKQQDIVAEMQLLSALLTLDESKLIDVIDATVLSTRIEYENYQFGRSSFRDLLQAHKDERVASLEHIDTVITYQLNSIKYDNLADRIIKLSSE